MAKQHLTLETRPEKQKLNIMHNSIQAIDTFQVNRMSNKLNNAQWTVITQQHIGSLYLWVTLKINTKV